MATGQLGTYAIYPACDSSDGLSPVAWGGDHNPLHHVLPCCIRGLLQGHVYNMHPKKLYTLANVTGGLPRFSHLRLPRSQ
jgi:hypothetical protein